MGYRIVSILTIIILMFAVVGLAASETGAEVFNSRCASCHGVDGAGKTKATKTFDGMPDLRAAAVQGKTDAQLFETAGRKQRKLADLRRLPQQLGVVGAALLDLEAGGGARHP